MAEPLRLMTDTDAVAPQTESKSVDPGKNHHNSEEYRIANDLKVCGDFGGEKPVGAPCMVEAGRGTGSLGTGRCYLHSDSKLEGDEQIKRKFIDEFMNQPMTVRQAAASAGVSYMTI